MRKITVLSFISQLQAELGKSRQVLWGLTERKEHLIGAAKTYGVAEGF